MLASELQRVGTPRVTPGRHLRRGERGLPSLPRRLRGRRDGDRPRHPGLSRSERHPAAGDRQARHQEGHRMDARLRERRARHAGLRHGARRGARRGGVHRRAGPFLRAAMRGHGAPHAVHLRIRVFRPARLDHRQHLGVQGAAAHGRAPRGEDQARAARSRHRRGDSRFPTRAAPARCRSPSCSGSSIARASSRTATSAARSSCRDRSSARSRCAAS